MKSSLTINSYEAWVHLGCDLEEQKHAQPVHFNFVIDYALECKGMTSDRLEDALDYVALSSIMKSVATAKPYHLIEHLNYSVFLKVREYLKSKSITGVMKLSVKKIRVPVEHLTDGVTFSCEEQL